MLSRVPSQGRQFLGLEGYKAEIGPSNVLVVGLNWKGTWEDQGLVQCRRLTEKEKRVVIRKGSAETQDHVTDQDTEVDDNNGLEEIGFVPSAVGEPLRAKHMWDKKCNEK